MPTWIIIILAVLAGHQCWIRGAGGNYRMRLWGLGCYALALYLLGLLSWVGHAFSMVLTSGPTLAFIVLAAAVMGLCKMTTGKWWPSR